MSQFEGSAVERELEGRRVNRRAEQVGSQLRHEVRLLSLALPMSSLTRGLHERPESSPTPPPKVIDLMIDAAVRNLLGQHREDGHWCAELEGDTILESEYERSFRTPRGACRP